MLCAPGAGHMGAPELGGSAERPDHVDRDVAPTASTRIAQGPGGELKQKLSRLPQGLLTDAFPATPQVSGTGGSSGSSSLQEVFELEGR